MINVINRRRFAPFLGDPFGRPATIIFSPGPPSAEIPFPTDDLIPSPGIILFGSN